MRRIKLKGGPKDREWVEVSEPLPRELSVIEIPKPEVSDWSDCFQPVEEQFVELKQHYYELRLYATTRFGGRKFYRYVYKR